MLTTMNSKWFSLLTVATLLMATVASCDGKKKSHRDFDDEDEMEMTEDNNKTTKESDGDVIFPDDINKGNNKDDIDKKDIGTDNITDDTTSETGEKSSTDGRNGGINDDLVSGNNSSTEDKSSWTKDDLSKMPNEICTYVQTGYIDKDGVRQPPRSGLAEMNRDYIFSGEYISWKMNNTLEIKWKYDHTEGQNLVYYLVATDMVNGQKSLNKDDVIVVTKDRCVINNIDYQHGKRSWTIIYKLTSRKRLADNNNGGRNHSMIVE